MSADAVDRRATFRAGRASRFGQLLVNAYGEELGGDPDEISADHVVSAARGVAQDRFSPYEASDQRFHVRGGNDQLVARLAQHARRRDRDAHPLLALSRRGDGRYRLVLCATAPSARKSPTA